MASAAARAAERRAATAARRRASGGVLCAPLVAQPTRQLATRALSQFRAWLRGKGFEATVEDFIGVAPVPDVVLEAFGAALFDDGVPLYVFCTLSRPCNG